METINVNYPDGRSHPIIFDWIEALPAHLETYGLMPGQVIVVTDSNVETIALPATVETLQGHGWLADVYSVEPGESSKSLANLQRLYDFVLKRPIDRQTPLVAVGGGVVGDLSGFCAATLLRGIPLIHVPTTLVSQVDSSIGGKTGINHPSGKNLIGSFHQPVLNLTDTRSLKTLPETEWRSGLGEVVKHALIDSRVHTVQLIHDWQAIVRRDESTVHEMVKRSARVKVGIVTADELEGGRRAVLNLGHTVGHGIERAAGYGRVTHGQAITAGMAVALRISDARHPGDDRSDAWELLRCVGWPALSRFDLAEVLEAMNYDKKRRAGALRFILLPRTGHPIISTDVTAEDIRRAWESLD